jgi:hypothetical protein
MPDKMLMQAVAYETLRVSRENPRAGHLIVAEAVENVENACREGKLHSIVQAGERDFGGFDLGPRRSSW